MLGSTQREDVVDRAALAAAGVDLVRRRSGGGAVLVEPERTVWIDVDVPVGDPLWSADVGRSFGWLGRTWAAALGALGLPAEVHDGRAVHDTVVAAHLLRRPRARRGDRGRGPRRSAWPSAGPATAPASRRAVNLAWDPAPLAGLLALGAEERAQVVADLRDAVVPVPGPADRVVDAFLATLP